MSVCRITTSYDFGQVATSFAVWGDYTPAAAYSSRLARLHGSQTLISHDAATLTITIRGGGLETGYTQTLQFVGDPEQDALPIEAS